MADPKLLVLGSNSFSGASFCDYLAEQGYDVVATSRSAEPHLAMLPYKWEKRRGSVRFDQIDINHDLDKLGALMRRERFTHVVNFAAQSMVGQSWDRPDDWMMTNVVSTVRLHVLLRGLDFLDRYVHVTTPEVYGSTEGWVREDTPFNPSTPYAVSRAAGDMSLKTFVDTYQLPAVSTRAANVYGPGQQLYRIIPRTIYAAMTGQQLKLDGGGKSVRVFIHMRDVSDATLKIALTGNVGETYHISGYELVTIRQLVEMILGRLGKSFTEYVEIGPDRPGKDQAYMLDSFKLRTGLGWQDRISLSQGLDDVIAWAERFRSDLPGLPAAYVHKP
ncbi:GDP-mannose 4,6-dehydratase [Phreatobacter stygius]|uniref:NAD-dependent epimerase/dehydratase family protein n=1 Tax=Phreatobacter stygius TaxID=1940610 RepID=A0A4D7AU95_9HYPH|nr:GDP-mannose 4,6-dehydratase [Phreatobacter stygius]QCI63181.1 NAD-dependent epimerase/dehydratase family protein [Phreatobacter stygius]